MTLLTVVLFKPGAGKEGVEQSKLRGRHAISIDTEQ